MNLTATISIMAGGVGSGCKGPNCGKKSGAKKMGNFDKDLLTKSASKKNMHEMAKMLMDHGFQRESAAGNYQKGSKSHGAAILGSWTTWKKAGEEVSPNVPGEWPLKSGYERFRFHAVTISPAGWSHSSSYKGDYVDNGRGLGADSLDKQLKKHGL